MTNTADLLLGNPCWVDLASTDPEASMRFYSALFDWHFTTDASHYATALAKGNLVAGLHPGPRTTWTLHLTIRNPWIAVERVRQHGGQVLRGPIDGRFVVAEDPSGAAVALSKPSPGRQFTVGVPGSFEWADLNTRDGQAADKFFRGLFGYSQGQVGDGVDLDYTIWWLGGTAVLGRYRMDSDFPVTTAPHWMLFFRVLDELGTDRTAECAERHGGTITVDPFDSAYGRVAVLEDPLGAAFSVISPTPDDEESYDDPYDD
ncbi:MAG: VOC family protein [Kutzneria sp.]|nr:VOC family protein [Kutzneria sp.]